MVLLDPLELGGRREILERGVQVVTTESLDFQGAEEKLAALELQGVTETQVPLGPPERRVFLAPRENED